MIFQYVQIKLGTLVIFNKIIYHLQLIKGEFQGIKGIVKNCGVVIILTAYHISLKKNILGRLGFECLFYIVIGCSERLLLGCKNEACDAVLLPHLKRVYRTVCVAGADDNVIKRILLHGVKLIELGHIVPLIIEGLSLTSCGYKQKHHRSKKHKCYNAYSFAKYIFYVNIFHIHDLSFLYSIRSSCI